MSEQELKMQTTNLAGASTSLLDPVQWKQPAVSDGIAMLECIDSVDAIKAISREIDDLSISIFDRTDWMVAWLEAYRSQYQQVCVLICRIDDRVVACLPLVKSTSLKKGRHFAFVGSGKACADFMGISGQNANQPEVIECFARWFYERKNEWDVLDFDGVACDHAAMASLIGALREKGLAVRESPSLSTWRVQLPATWKELERIFSKNARKKFRKLERTLNEADVKMHRVRDNASLERGLEILESLHTQRWNSLGKPGCFVSPNFREFVAIAAKSHLGSGNLRMMWLEVDGVPFSADIGFVNDHGVFGYQGGMSPDHLKYEPGRAILRRQIEWAIEDGFEFFDFLRGDESYKSRWNADGTKAMRVEVFGAGTRANLIRGILWLGRRVKRILRRS